MVAPEDTRVLVVEDNPLDRKLLDVHLRGHGYEPQFTKDGAEAWAILERDPDAFDVVLLDRSMPVMGGLELLGRMKEHPRLRMLPVIMQTASGRREDIVEGIRAGAYYYLTKPYDRDMLAAVVNTAASDYAEYRELQEQLRKGLKSLRLMSSATLVIRTLSEARDVAAILANACPDPETVVIGLTELLLNAVEHGNLGITYQEKSEFVTRDEWHAEIERRERLPENVDKRVRLVFERSDHEICFTITDEGSGFDWQRYWDIDPQRAFDRHGRGILMARRFSFSAVEYRGRGNEVMAKIAV